MLGGAGMREILERKRGQERRAKRSSSSNARYITYSGD